VHFAYTTDVNALLQPSAAAAKRLTPVGGPSVRPSVRQSALAICINVCKPLLPSTLQGFSKTSGKGNDLLFNVMLLRIVQSFQQCSTTAYQGSVAQAQLAHKAYEHLLYP